MADTTRFELQIYQVDHWVTEKFLMSEAGARAEAAKAFANPKCTGVRVVKSTERSDGRVMESELMSQMREATKAPVTAVAVEDAPLCQTIKDFVALPARMTLNRVLRKYFDQRTITPTELLYTHRELRRLDDQDTLMANAVGVVSRVQGTKGEGDAGVRRNMLYDAHKKLSERTRLAEARGLPALREGTFAQVWRQLNEFGDTEEKEFLAMVILARDMNQQRGWLGKLYRLMKMRDGDLEPAPAALVDGAMADVLGSATVIQDLVGQQNDLFGAIMGLIDLVESKVAADKRPPDDMGAALSKMMAGGDLESCRLVLIDWIIRQLKANAPLSKGKPAETRPLIKTLLQRLARGPEFIGGPPMAEALTMRYMLTLEAGGNTGKSQAIAGMVEMSNNRADALKYLANMALTDLGKAMPAEVALHLRRLFDRVATMMDLSPPGTTPIERMATLALAQRQLKDAELPGKEQIAFANKLDLLVVKYLIEEKVIEKIDNPDDSLRLRAMKLVKLASDRILTEGKATDVAKAAIIGHLKQPGFEAKFTADIADPKEKEKALREFHELLAISKFF